MEKIVSISLLDKNDSYRDLLLEIYPLSIKLYADSYYFLLDRNIDDKEYNIKIIRVLIVVLGKWLIRLNDIVSLNYYPVFLPFEFSDQYIGCLKVSYKKDCDVLLQWGFTQKIMGMDIFPSNIEKFVIDNNAFEAISEEVEINRDFLVENIETMIRKFKNDIGNPLYF